MLDLIVHEKCWSTPVYEDSSSLKNRFKIDSPAKQARAFALRMHFQFDLIFLELTRI
jgi:hypothetical protein